MKKLLYLSDLHTTHGLTKQPQGLRSAARAQTMFQALRDGAAGDPQEIVVCITGDLVDEYTDENVEFMRAELERLRTAGFVVIVCAGNHDYYLPHNRTVQAGQAEQFWAKFILPMLQQPGVTARTPAPVVNDYPLVLDVGPDLSFLVLDTDLGGQGRKTVGELGSNQREQIAERLATIEPERRLVVVMHHDPMDAVFPMRLLGDDRWALQKALRSRPADLLLCGHTHNPELRFGHQLEDWPVTVAANGGTSTGHENSPKDRSESPHWLFEFTNLANPRDLKLPWPE